MGSLDNDYLVKTRGICNTDVTFCDHSETITTSINYEGCVLTATADFYVCSGAIRMILRDPVWTYSNSTACKKLKRKMADAYITPYIGTQLALDIYNDIHREVVNALQESFLSRKQEKNWEVYYSCYSSPAYPCQSYSYNNLIYLTMSDCISLCVESIDMDGLPNLATVKCGVGCCERVNRFCFDSNGGYCLGPSTITQLGVCTSVPTNCLTSPVVCSAACERL